MVTPTCDHPVRSRHPPRNGQEAGADGSGKKKEPVEKKTKAEDFVIKAKRAPKELRYGCRDDRSRHPYLRCQYM